MAWPNLLQVPTNRAATERLGLRTEWPMIGNRPGDYTGPTSPLPMWVLPISPIDVTVGTPFTHDFQVQVPGGDTFRLELVTQLPPASPFSVSFVGDEGSISATGEGTVDLVFRVTNTSDPQRPSRTSAPIRVNAIEATELTQPTVVRSQVIGEGVEIVEILTFAGPSQVLAGDTAEVTWSVRYPATLTLIVEDS